MDDVSGQGTTAASQTTTTRRSPAKRAAYAVLGFVLGVIAYLVVWPSPIEPVAYEPPAAPPLEGVLAPNDRLKEAELLVVGKVDGPEDVEVDAAGRITTGTADGRVLTIEPDGTIRTLANTGGRPVGIATAPDGQLIVADANKGLLSIDPADGKITTLSTSADDVPFKLVDDVAVASDGTIYFSDASSKYNHDQILFDLLEGRPHGRLLRYDPATKETTVLLDDLHFANGVALSKNEDFLLVNETYRFRTIRYWLKGEQYGTSEVFLDNLPGYPDNITSNGAGTFWLALFTVRNPQADSLAPKPFMKSVLAKLPSFLWPKPQRYAFVIKLDESGKILDSLQDPSGKHLYEVTSAFERDGYLYLGSLHNDRIGKIKP